MILSVTVSNRLMGNDAYRITIIKGDQFDDQIPQVSRTGESFSDLLPIVFCPRKTGSLRYDSSLISFYVVIENTQNKATKIKMFMSDWYSGLTFKLVNAAKESYSIQRPDTPWTVNGPMSLTFPPHGIRIMPVNFINEEWDGLPAAPSPPEVMQMTATFSYSDANDPLHSLSVPHVRVMSKPTDVIFMGIWSK